MANHKRTRRFTKVRNGMLIALAFGFQQPGVASDTLPWNIPTRIRTSVERTSFKASFEIGTWLNPFYLRGDFDGDGIPDYAVLIKRRSDGKKGIAIWLSSTPASPPHTVGAGTKSKAGAGLEDNWDFFDSWQVYGKSPKLIGEAILIEKTEAAGGLLFWDGKQFRWRQQGD